MKPLFGSLNGSIAKAIAANLPRYSRIVEPFGDNGTLAFMTEKRRPREHLLNVGDPVLFAAFSFVQSYTSGDMAALRARDWVGSQEAFDEALAVSDEEGPDFFWRFLYFKKFGMAMGDAEPELDVLSIGSDQKHVLFALPMMRSLLKGVTLSNDPPLNSMAAASGSDTFLLLLPKSAEDAAAVESRLGGLGATYFFAGKIADAMEALDKVGSFGDANVGAMRAPSIMMGKVMVVWNYPPGRRPKAPQPLDPELLQTAVGGR